MEDRYKGIRFFVTNPFYHNNEVASSLRYLSNEFNIDPDYLIALVVDFYHLSCSMTPDDFIMDDTRFQYLLNNRAFAMYVADEIPPLPNPMSDRLLQHLRFIMYHVSNMLSHSFDLLNKYVTKTWGRAEYLSCEVVDSDEDLELFIQYYI